MFWHKLQALWFWLYGWALTWQDEINAAYDIGDILMDTEPAEQDAYSEATTEDDDDLPDGSTQMIARYKL